MFITSRVSPKVNFALSLLLLSSSALYGQSLGNAGTVQGAITDPSGAAVPNAVVLATNPVSGYTQTVVSGTDGEFRLVNLPPNSYHVQASARGFASHSQDVTIRNSLPIHLDLKLSIAVAGTMVTVELERKDLLEVDSSAHVDVDRSTFSKIPTFDPAGGLSQAIIYSSGEVAADGNGFFHPLGDHAQTTFFIDGQPISNQQSKVFSTQLSDQRDSEYAIDYGSSGGGVRGQIKSR